jgi:hypothetical protein
VHGTCSCSDSAARNYLVRRPPSALHVLCKHLGVACWRVGGLFGEPRHLGPIKSFRRLGNGLVSGNERQFDQPGSLGDPVQSTSVQT